MCKNLSVPLAISTAKTEILEGDGRLLLLKIDPAEGYWKFFTIYGEDFTFERAQNGEEERVFQNTDSNFLDLEDGQSEVQLHMVKFGAVYSFSVQTHSVGNDTSNTTAIQQKVITGKSKYRNPLEKIFNHFGKFFKIC